MRYLKYLELASTIMYHVTSKRNWAKIRTEGLKPKIGPRSSKLKEKSGIFLFTSMDHLEDALMNWLGEEFEDDETLAILKVTVDINKLVIDPSVVYEAIYTQPISPKDIKLVRYE